MPLLAASAARWSRALRPGWNALASSSAPTSRSGQRRSRKRRPPMRARPASGRSRPRISRIVVDLPDPLAPEEPGHHPRPDVEAERVDRERGAVALGQVTDLDHVNHARSRARRPERGQRPSSAGGFPPGRTAGAAQPVQGSAGPGRVSRSTARRDPRRSARPAARCGAAAAPGGAAWTDSQAARALPSRNRLSCP